MTTSDPPVPAPKTGWKPRTKLVLVGALAVPLLLFALYTWAALSWSYSDGYRAGILQKFSRKGWICKTYEGELAQSVVPGMAPTIWLFSVRDAGVAHQIEAVLGRKVSLHYREHLGIPTSCFATTSYFVDSVSVVE